MDEAETQKRLGEKALANAGWTPIVDYAQGSSYEKSAVKEYDSDN